MKIVSMLFVVALVGCQPTAPEHATNSNLARDCGGGWCDGDDDDQTSEPCVTGGSYGTWTCDETKVTLCHVPPGNPSAAHTITIGESAVEHHLENHPGDHLGECTCEDSGTCETESTGDTGVVVTGDTGTETVSTGDTGTLTIPTGTDVTGSTGDTGVESDTDTDSDTDADVDTDTDSDTEVTSTGVTGSTGDTGVTVITTPTKEVWVQNGCNTVPITSLLGSLIALALVRRKQ